MISLPKDTDLLASRDIDLEGLERVPGKTFFWAGKYTDDMNDRVTLTTDLNVFADFNPKFPRAIGRTLSDARKHSARLQRSVRAQMKKARLAGGDTMNSGSRISATSCWPPFANGIFC